MNALSYFIKKNIPKNDTEEAVKFMIRQGIIPFTVVRRIEILKTFQENFHRLSNGKERSFRERDSIKRCAVALAAQAHKVTQKCVYQIIRDYKSLK